MHLNFSRFKYVSLCMFLALLVASSSHLFAQDIEEDSAIHAEKKSVKSNNISEAESYLLGAIEAAKNLGQPNTKLTATLCDLARLYVGQGKYYKAEAIFKQVLAMYAKDFGPEHADVADVKNSLAEVYRLEGKYSEAEPLFKEALAIDQANMATNPEYVARDLNGLGKLYLDEGRYADAEPLLKQALDVRQKFLAPADPDVAFTMLNYAQSLRHLNRVLQADTLEQQARQILAQP